MLGVVSQLLAVIGVSFERICIFILANMLVGESVGPRLIGLISFKIINLSGQ